ncbi:MAG: GTP 3',8-cyclase MoaA [Bacillota bacterium]|nr:GTP 3',8-cyclase MoaA [Bacillota bacterium]
MGAELVDRFGRVVRKMRISVTDRCNFRCQYCMPSENVRWLPRGEILSFEEITRVTRVAVGLGVRRVRLTGGEPLARPELEVLVGQLAAIEGLQDLSMTTNGYFLPEKAEALRAAGLKSVNISLDSLRRERFAELTRRDSLERVLEGIRAARAAGFPVKINTVLMRGVNEDEVADLIAWSGENGVLLRFIEFMPLDGDRQWSRERVVTAGEILAQAAKLGPVEAVEADPHQPARLYRAAGVVFGIIASVSQPFCRQCDRIRLTADGKIRNCLFALAEADLRGPLRAGADDQQLAAVMRDAVWSKWEGHLINQTGFRPPERAMYAIGG